MAIDDDILKEMVKENPWQTTRDLAAKLGVDYTTVFHHLKNLNMVCKLDVWVPHKLSEKNFLDQYSACSSLLSHHECEPFLDRIVTGDDKWIVYDNVVRKRHWSPKGETSLTVAKPDLHQNKMMLCYWWDCKSIVYFELLKSDETINADKYCNQLDNLKEALHEKRPNLINRKGVIFHQDNVRPHRALKTLEKLQEFGWEILMHPPYSPDIAPSDFLFV